MKKSIIKVLAVAIAIISVLCCGMLSVSAAVVTDGADFYELGDVNKDKTVDIRDLICFKQHLADSTKEIFAAAGDTNSDSAVDVKDILEIKRYLLGTVVLQDSGSWDTQIR